MPKMSNENAISRDWRWSDNRRSAVTSVVVGRSGGLYDLYDIQRGFMKKVSVPRNGRRHIKEISFITLVV